MVQDFRGEQYGYGMGVAVNGDCSGRMGGGGAKEVKGITLGIMGIRNK